MCEDARNESQEKKKTFCSMAGFVRLTSKISSFRNQRKNPRPVISSNCLPGKRLEKLSQSISLSLFSFFFYSLPSLPAVPLPRDRLTDGPANWLRCLAIPQSTDRADPSMGGGRNLPPSSADKTRSNEPAALHLPLDGTVRECRLMETFVLP